MATLEELKAGAAVRGLSPEGVAKVVQVEWFGDQAVKVTFEDATGAARNRLVYRNEEPTLKIVEVGRPWSFDGDGALLRLVSEAFKHLGGRFRKRETGRWEITRVPGPNGGSEPVPLTMTGR